MAPANQSRLPEESGPPQLFVTAVDRAGQVERIKVMERSNCAAFWAGVGGVACVGIAVGPADADAVAIAVATMKLRLFGSHIQCDNGSQWEESFRDGTSDGFDQAQGRWCLGQG